MRVHFGLSVLAGIFAQQVSAFSSETMPCSHVPENEIKEFLLEGNEHETSGDVLHQDVVRKMLDCTRKNEACVVGVRSEKEYWRAGPRAVQVWSNKTLGSGLQGHWKDDHDVISYAGIQLAPSDQNGGGVCILAKNMYMMATPWLVLAWKIADGQPERYVIDIADPTTGFHFGGTPERIVDTMHAAWPDKFKPFQRFHRRKGSAR